MYLEEVYFNEAMTEHTEHMDDTGVVCTLDGLDTFPHYENILKSTVAVMKSSSLITALTVNKETS